MLWRVFEGNLCPCIITGLHENGAPVETGAEARAYLCLQGKDGCLYGHCHRWNISQFRVARGSKNQSVFGPASITALFPRSRYALPVGSVFQIVRSALLHPLPSLNCRNWRRPVGTATENEAAQLSRKASVSGQSQGRARSFEADAAIRSADRTPLSTASSMAPTIDAMCGTPFAETSIQSAPAATALTADCSMVMSRIVAFQSRSSVRTTPPKPNSSFKMPISSAEWRRLWQASSP